MNNASICDENGELLFYTNGCAIADANQMVMPHGDSINYGNFFSTLWLDDCGNGYPGQQHIIILDDPVNESGYYVIHKTREFDPSQDPSIFINTLKYSYVDLTLNNGMGDVTVKNEIFILEEYMVRI